MSPDGFWDLWGNMSVAFDDGIGGMLTKAEVDKLVENDLKEAESKKQKEIRDLERRYGIKLEQVAETVPAPTPNGSSNSEYWSPTAWYNWPSSKEEPAQAVAPPTGKVPELIKYKHLITPHV